MKLDGWIPIRMFWQDGQPLVEWCLLGAERFTDPFFEGTIQRRLNHPFHHVFRRQTPMDALLEWRERRPGVEPAGFIFHMSRCGSTLICRMLAALERNLVLSEPAPADSVLRAHFRDGAITVNQRVEWLRAMLSALGQKRSDAEDRLFVKFDCWSIAELPIIRQAFPATPWIFLYRDPLEVLASQLTQPAGWTFPGMLHPAVLGIPSGEAAEAPHDEYAARALARICRFALFHHRGENGALVNYSQLPEFAVERLPAIFGVAYDRRELETMREAARFNSKTPSLAFEADGSAKAENASGRMRELAERWIAPVYEQLEAERTSEKAGISRGGGIGYTSCNI